MTRPEDFASEAPPARTMGTECEYNMQSPTGTDLNSSFLLPKYMLDRGIQNHKSFLGEDFGSGRAYPDVGHLEYATKEVIGPAAAAVEDLEGISYLSSIIATAPHIPHSGLYRFSGTYIPDGQVRGIDEPVSSGVTNGYHENYLVPRAITTDPLVDVLLPTVVATRVWAMGGTLRQDGFSLSQKVWGTGDEPISRQVDRRLNHGTKPMIMIPPVSNDNDTIGKDHWARVEVRMADPGLSLVGRFASFAGMSLALRLIEQKHRIDSKKLGEFCLSQPVVAAKAFARDLSLTKAQLTRSGRSLSALDIQESLLDVIEPLSDVVELPRDERFAIGVLRQLIDALRSSNPLKAQYSPGAILRLDFAAKHRFIVGEDDPASVTAYNKAHMQRSLLWDRVLPEGNGVLFWRRAEEKDPLIAPIKHLAATAGILPRAERRAEMIARNNGEFVMGWSRYSDRLGHGKSLGNPIGD